MIGDIVKVIIDRPLGTFHPKHKDIYYSVNYGYIPGVIAPDGEEQDAYILGVNQPVKEFIGKVIAIIHRFDDVEEKGSLHQKILLLQKMKLCGRLIFKNNTFVQKSDCKIPFCRIPYAEQSKRPVEGPKGCCLTGAVRNALSAATGRQIPIC